MPDGDRYELVRGQLRERKMSTWCSYVAGRIHLRLGDLCVTHRRGWVFPEGTSYQCFPHDPSRVRRPDVSFIAANRLSASQAAAEGHCSIYPDLAVEVVSPHDLAYEVNEKVADFLEAGTPLVWVVHPKSRTVEVHRPGHDGIILHADRELDGGEVLPGFCCRVGDLFELPPGVERELS
jgi:Uma2 family endonuclease